MTTATQEQTKTNNTAIAKADTPKPIIRVGNMVRGYLEKGQLHLPSNYSAENAMKSAWLKLQETGALNGATDVSVVNALLNMVIQGLNPAKTQCYFIKYGQQLVCQRSYFGDMALVKRILPGVEFFYAPFYSGEKVVPKRVNGKLVSIEHEEDMTLKKPENLGGAYCLVLDSNGEVVAGEIMTIERIRKSWGMSKTYKAEATAGTHHDFPDEMAVRTVVRKVCKPIINSSDDELLVRSAAESDMDAIDAEITEEAEEFGNQETVAIESQPVEQTTEPDQTVESQTEEDPGY